MAKMMGGKKYAQILAAMAISCSSASGLSWFLCLHQWMDCYGLYIFSSG